MNPKKGSFEDVFSHLGTPQEVAEEWTALLALKSIVKTLHHSPIDSDAEDASYKALVKWIRQNP